MGEDLLFMVYPKFCTMCIYVTYEKDSKRLLFGLFPLKKQVILTLWKRQSYMDGEQISCCQGFGWEVYLQREILHEGNFGGGGRGIEK